MKAKEFFSKIHVRITLSFLLVALIIVGLLSSIAYYSAAKIILDTKQRQTADAIDQTSDYIASYLDKIKTLSDLIAMYPETTEALRRSNERSIESLAGMVNISASSDPRIQTIAVISKNGFAITSNSNMAVPLSENMMEEPWYKGALSSKQMPVITSIRHGDFTMDKESWVISISHEIVDDKGEHLGVVLIDVYYHFIEDYIRTLDLGASGYAYILNSVGEVLYHPDENVFMDEKKIQELQALALEAGQSDPKKHIITGSNIPHSDWTLVGVSSMESVEDLKDSYIGTIALVNILLIASGLFIGLLLSHRLTKPIVELQNAMMELDENWGHLTIDPKSSVEIIHLAEEYNALIDRIRILTQDIAQKENAKRIFELKALQSQINPHFLYNTLDTILWLAEFGENKKVVEVSKALGEMLRLSLNIDQSVVTLEQELAHAENYLKIQQKRYEDKISYRIEGDEKLLSSQVPKSILQPIVENSIYHGIRPMKGMGQIRIHYERQGDHLLLTVEDNGVGYDPDRKNDNNLIRTKLGGIGMSNVDQRIKILCGAEYGIDVQKKETGGTLVRYRIKI
ncbi:MAG: sensor histidine kinase [Peptostreptococcaceae bacterium]|nr:sensor histidine kinase [Peptostreptococcaceae bacterium]